METPSCPYCRQKMNMILPYFSQTELTDDSDVTVAATRAEILDKIRQYNRFYSGEILIVNFQYKTNKLFDMVNSRRATMTVGPSIRNN